MYPAASAAGSNNLTCAGRGGQEIHAERGRQNRAADRETRRAKVRQTSCNAAAYGLTSLNTVRITKAVALAFSSFAGYVTFSMTSGRPYWSVAV